MILGDDSRSDIPTLFQEAVAIMERLRRPDGCPWDREQTFDTIKKHTLEETYEVFDAIERRAWQDLCEELGDLLLQVLFYSQMAAESHYFSIADVVRGLNEKLIRRHPHVFGDSAELENARASDQSSKMDASAVLNKWEEIKKSEKVGKPPQSSILDAVPRALPAVVEARKLGSAASRVGFDWGHTSEVVAKLEEECNEVKEAMEQAKEDASMSQSKIESEVGDLLFTVVNLARHLKVDPEMALRETNARFRRRFSHMESQAETPLSSLSPTQLESLWSLAKEAELRK